MKHRLFFSVVVILLGLAPLSSFAPKLSLAQEPAAGAAPEATPETGNAAPATDQDPPTAEDPPAAEEPAAEEPAAATASSGSAPAASSPTGPAKIVDSNKAAADQQRDVSRTAGMIAGISFLIVLAYFLTRKKAKPTNG
jgi:cytoskeletal protein RodZ